jgi:hypothetical protein
MPIPKCGSFVSRKLHSIPQRLLYFFPAFSSLRLVARHQGSFHVFGLNADDSPYKMAFGGHRGAT